MILCYCIFVHDLTLKWHYIDTRPDWISCPDIIYLFISQHIIFFILKLIYVKEGRFETVYFFGRQDTFFFKHISYTLPDKTIGPLQLMRVEDVNEIIQLFVS